MSNAGDASEPGSEIRVVATQYSRTIEIELNDQGTGIAEENLESVFDPFVTTKTAGRGTGLGLSIVHRIIEEHKGTITLHSTLGVGTTAHITLPALEPL